MTADKWRSTGAERLLSYKDKQVGVICEDCEILKFFEGDVLFDKYGDLAMPNLLTAIAKDHFKCERTANQFYERCKLIYYKRLDERDRQPEPAEDQRDSKTLGELHEWEGIIAFCGNANCRRKRPLDRWALQRQLGKNTKISAIGPRLRCKCGHRGANIVIGYISR